MKIELNTTEATDLFTQLAQASKVASLEEQLADARSEVETSYRSRSEAWRRAEELDAETHTLRQANDEVRRELSNLRRDIEIMIDQAKPFFRERAFSEMFALYRAGQRIPCIKKLREVMKLDLRTAKDIVEREYTNGNNPELFALCLVFTGISASATLDYLREQLVKVLKSDLSADDLNRVLHGEFHEPDIKF